MFSNILLYFSKFIAVFSDLFAAGAGCKVCDVIFHPDVYSTAVKV